MEDLAAHGLRVLCWNAFGAAQSARTFLGWLAFGDRPDFRGAVHAHRFEHEDVAAVCDAAEVVCLQEVWLPEVERFLHARPHPHKVADENHTTLRPLAFGGSGLAVASRHPIVSTLTRAFAPPHVGAERFARKGMMHARLEVRGAEVDVINTHLQSGRSRGAVAVRVAQIEQLRRFAEEVGSASRPLVVCGDFNVDALRPKRDFEALARAFEGFEDLGAHEGHATFDPETNVLARLDGPEALPERLDYVLFRAPKSGPTVTAGPVSLELRHALASPGREPTNASDHAALRFDLRLAGRIA